MTGGQRDGPVAVPLTRGPRHHFFGYYEICPWNATGQYHLCLETVFHDRPPKAQDEAAVGLVERGSTTFQPLARTQAFNLQQGAMLHWLPTNPAREICYNARQGDRHVAVRLDIHSGHTQVLPRPVSGLSHSGILAASLNFARLAEMRPVVGYRGLPDLFRGQGQPEDDGLFILNMLTGEADLILSYAQIRDLFPQYSAMSTHGLWFNHTEFSPDDRRVLAVVRWNEPGIEISHTMLFSVGVDGRDVRMLAPLGASHFTWRSNREVFGWLTFEAGEWYYRLDADTGEVSAPFCPDLLTRNGHCSFSADGRWLLTDEHWSEHWQKGLVLFDMRNQRRVELGRYTAPDRFRGEIRCDLHPRFNRSQTAVSFDSVHEGTRQVYEVDVAQWTADKTETDK
ncbi:MAG: hypothetical protein F4Z18_03925 [Caldilineaceae bacterium SB0666_bin_21]|nr:hypothetical protein [Caldilineaceae bacterium SB0666_bin_21]